MKFYRQPVEKRSAHVQRIMVESVQPFSQEAMAGQYLALYTRLLKRPVVLPRVKKQSGARNERRHADMRQEAVA
jgi:hypothetical protein